MSKGIPNDKKQRRNKIDYIEVFNQFKKDGDTGLLSDHFQDIILEFGNV